MRNLTVIQPALVLVHSPLVGPLTWEPAAERLQSAGRVVVVPSLAGVMDSGPPYYLRLAARVAGEVVGACAGSRVVLAGHSGAGALLPAIAAEIAACGNAADVAVHCAIFVDAILPHPGQTWFETAPTAG